MDLAEQRAFERQLAADMVATYIASVNAFQLTRAARCRKALVRMIGKRRADKAIRRELLRAGWDI